MVTVTPRQLNELGNKIQANGQYLPIAKSIHRMVREAVDSGKDQIQISQEQLRAFRGISLITRRY